LGCPLLTQSGHAASSDPSPKAYLHMVLDEVRRFQTAADDRGGNYKPDIDSVSFHIRFMKIMGVRYATFLF
jgi:hypothetical protein